MLAILVTSGLDSFFPAATTKRRKGSTDVEPEPGRLANLVRSAAAAQIALAVLALTTYHVQIITRISSGYPVWYWWLGGKLVRGEAWGNRIVVFMVMYASIQGALFASFLPPA